MLRLRLSLCALSIAGCGPSMIAPPDRSLLIVDSNTNRIGASSVEAAQASKSRLALQEQ